MDRTTTIDLRRDQSVPLEVMIFGSGACARKIAANLAHCGVASWLAAGHAPAQETDSQGITHWLNGAKLVRCRGFAGHFELQLEQEQSLLNKKVPAIVVAEDDQRSANYMPYGLASGPRVMSISTLEEKLCGSSTKSVFENNAKIVFLCGWPNDAHPSVTKRMLDGCLRLQERAKIRAFFMTGNLKVAANGAEDVVMAAKRSGAVFLKFTHDYPHIQSLADDRFAIDYIDELTRTDFQLEADWLVVDESTQPDPGLAALTQRLGIHQDGSGFAQADNVRRMSNATNRRGVFVAGGSRGILSEDEQMVDADQVSLNVLAFLKNMDDETLPEVAIQPGRCARCLTCHRLCPHGAIDVGSRISVVTEACHSCGICVAGCPAGAIEMQGVHIDGDVNRRWQAQGNTAEVGSPIIVFGCARSAAQALALARDMGHGLPAQVQFVEVPCGGTISSNHLLAAFESGADGVMLCTCHSDNCQSQIGNQVARKRADRVSQLMTAAGWDSDRLRFSTVAANMGSEIIFMIKNFVDHVGALDDS